MESALFTDSFREQVANLLSRCSYQKDLGHLLQPDTDFGAQWNMQEVRLDNYYLNHIPGGDYTGVCYELTYHVGQQLQQQLGEAYEFMAADGNCPQFYFEESSNHTFILAFPRKPETFGVYSLARLQQAYIIDPSFGIHGAMGIDEAVKGYTVKCIYDFDEIRPSRNRSEVLPFQWFENGYGQTHTLPLGLSQYLLPPDCLGDDYLLVVGFQIKPDTDVYPKVLLGAKTADENAPSIRKDVVEKLPVLHPMKQFLDKLQTDLMNCKVSNQGLIYLARRAVLFLQTQVPYAACLLLIIQTLLEE